MLLAAALYAPITSVARASQGHVFRFSLSPFWGRLKPVMNSLKCTKRWCVKMTIDPMVRANAEVLPEVIDRGGAALAKRLLREEIIRRKISASDKS